MTKKKPKAVLSSASAAQPVTEAINTFVAAASVRAKHTIRDQEIPVALAVGAYSKPEARTKLIPGDGPPSSTKHASSTSIKPPVSPNLAVIAFTELMFLQLSTPALVAQQTTLPLRTVDPLQLAAQLYPWLYMISHLETAFQTSEVSAQVRTQLKYNTFSSTALTCLSMLAECPRQTCLRAN